MTNKQARQAAILDLVAEHVVGSQEDLDACCSRAGWMSLRRHCRATYATCTWRVCPEARRCPIRASGVTCGRRRQTVLATLLPQLFSRVDGVGELVVLHTVPSGAQPIAEAIDRRSSPEVLGTIAGDDTILIVTRSAGARVQLTERLRALAGEG